MIKEETKIYVGRYLDDKNLITGRVLDIKYNAALIIWENGKEVWEFDLNSFNFIE